MSLEVDLGVTTPSFMRGGNHDIIGFDGIYYFTFGARPFEWLNLRLSKHHICTHSGDEDPSGNVNSVTGGYIFPLDINKRRLRIGFNY